MLDDPYTLEIAGNLPHPTFDTPMVSSRISKAVFAHLQDVCKLQQYYSIISKFGNYWCYVSEDG